MVRGGFAFDDKADRQSGLEAADDCGGWAEDAGGVAGGEIGGARRVGEEAAEAGGVARPDSPDAAFDAHAGAVDPGDVIAAGEVVDEVAGGDVVGAVEDQIDIREGFDVGGVGVGDDGVDFDFVIDLPESLGGGDGLGEFLGRVIFVEEQLALEIAEFDEVAIDDAEEADAGAGEELGGDGAEGAAADDQGAGAVKARLAFRADLGENFLAAKSGHDNFWSGRL